MRPNRSLSRSLHTLRSRVPQPTVKDSREVAVYVILLPLVAIPRPVGLAACGILARLLMRYGSPYERVMTRSFPRPLMEQLGRTRSEALRRSETLVLYDRVLTLRSFLLPWWKRPVTVVGLHHVEEALAAHNGAILWVHQCVSSNLMVKFATKSSGHPLIHLSRPGHGFSDTSFGKRLASPLLRRGEDRYLAERVVLDEVHTVGPLRQLRRRLRENQVVSITVTATALHLDALPCLGGSLWLSPGPVELAEASSAALLPVFTVGSASRATVIIGPPLPVAGKSAASTRESEAAAAHWLEEQSLAHPADWIGWRLNAFVAG